MNIAYVLRRGVVFIGITLLGEAHPIWEHILGAGYVPVDGSRLGLQE